MTKNKFRRIIETLRTKNGRENTNNELEKYLTDQDRSHLLSVPHSPARNGVAEMKNRALIKMTKCMVLEAGVHEILLRRCYSYINVFTKLSSK